MEPEMEIHRSFLVKYFLRKWEAMAQRHREVGCILQPVKQSLPYCRESSFTAKLLHHAKHDFTCLKSKLH